MPRRYFPLSFATALFVFSTLTAFGIPILWNGPAKYISPVREFFGIGLSSARPVPTVSFIQGRDDNAIQADQFFAGDGTGLATAKWGTSAAGPFTSLFTSGNVANFAVVNGTGTGGSITVGGINAVENFTITSPSGTISNVGNGIVPINVASGKTLDFSTQSFTSSATAGYNFTGPGTLALAGNTYGGGFTINSGTLIARGVNAMGGTGANTLTINGGTIAANATRDFTGKYGGGIILGGNVQLGALAANVPLALDGASLTFSNNVSLGAATRTITIGGNGVYIFSGVISGSPGAGLTITALPGASGAIDLSGANTYTGNTTITNGALDLIGSGSISNSPVIEIGPGGIFTVNVLSSPLTLSAGQTLRASGTSTTGRIGMSSTRGLTTAANTPIQFTAFNRTTPPLTVTGGGSLALQSGNPVTVTVSNGGTPLSIGNYKLIAKLNSATVSGAPSSVTVNGDGIAAGTVASLVNTSGELFLHVAASPGTIQLSSATYSVGEGDSNATITVTRTDGSGGAVSVNYSTGNGSATGGADCSGGADFTNTSGMLSWTDGESTAKTFDIPICDDAVFEASETVNIALSSPTGGASLGSPNASTLTIADNDVDAEEPTTTITGHPTDPGTATADFSFSGNDTGGSGLAGFECQIDAGGFAACTSPKQYTGLSGASHTFDVRAKDNAGNVDSTPASFTWTVDADPPDTSITSTPPTPMASQYADFEFTGSDPVGGSGLAGFECSLNGAAFAPCASPTTVTAVFSIANSFRVRSSDVAGNVDPTPAEFIWTPVPGSAVEFAPPIIAPEGLIKTVTLQRTGDTSGSASVDWTTVASSTAFGAASCDPGVDFQTASGTVNFAAGESSQSFALMICGDNQIEPAEYFAISLSNAVGVGYGYPYTGVITIRDTANEYKTISSTDIFGGATSELPSITISGSSSVGGLRVSLFNVTHPNPDNLDFLLVGPQGQTFVMMADVGGSSGLTDATITLEDAASVQLPDSTAINPLINYRPAVCTFSGTVSNFLGTAPPGPYNQAGCTTATPTFSSVFGNHDPIGSWRLFVRDDSGDPGAAIPVGSVDGWGMQILSPTASTASLSGRVQTPQGFGIRNALVTITGVGLSQPKVVVTGSFGVFRFDDLPVGAVYVVSVQARRYAFAQASMGVSLQDNIANLNFVSER